MNVAEPAEVFLSYGANLGDRESALNRALLETAALPDTKLLVVSSIYETEPWGYAEQPSFLNCAARISTRMEPARLHRAMAGIEKKMGRKPAPRNHPRVIDIDILLYGDRVLELAGLVIPHPAMLKRRFVLAPLCEIAPDLTHPTAGRSMKELLAACADGCAVSIFAAPASGGPP